VALGLPAAYVQGYGNPRTTYGYKDVSLFVQDDWGLTRRLTRKPGLRYQRQFWPSVHYSVSNVGVPRFADDLPQYTNEVAPRLAGTVGSAPTSPSPRTWCMSAASTSSAASTTTRPSRPSAPDAGPTTWGGGRGRPPRCSSTPRSARRGTGG